MRFGKLPTRAMSLFNVAVIGSRLLRQVGNEQLLAADSDVDDESSANTPLTPLHYAALHGHETIIRLQLSDNADINSRSRTGATPLHLASKEGHLASVLTLLQAGADPLLAQADGVLPIHKAAKHNKSEVVRILIKQGGCSPDQVRHTAQK